MSTALTIAGSDPCGGAGIQADLRAFDAHGVEGTSVITALTAQNAHLVRAIEPVSGAFVGAQLDVLLESVRPRAVKTGMLATAENVTAVCDRLESLRAVVVVDPVAKATSGPLLLESAARTQLLERLLPLSTLVTPNLDEAGALLGRSAPATMPEMEAAARDLVRELDVRSALVKGGHAQSEACVDVFFDGRELLHFTSPRVRTHNTHGTGCMLSAAICALAAKGASMAEAIPIAKRYVVGVLERRG